MVARPGQTFAEALSAAALELDRVGVDSPRLDAEVLLAFACGFERVGLYRRMRDPLDDVARQRFGAALARRCEREPVAYITGEKEFWSLRFEVNGDVLVPRPESELLVEVVLSRLAPGASASVCDLGTGSGCLAVAVAHSASLARLTAVDLSPAAVRVARRNAELHGVAQRIDLLAGDLFEPLCRSGRFAAIVANPPYLAAGEECAPELAWEPRLALCGGAAGFDVIDRILSEAPGRLDPGGILAMEVGLGQAERASRRARDAGFARIEVRPDLAGIPRVLVAQRVR